MDISATLQICVACEGLCFYVTITYTIISVLRQRQLGIIKAMRPAATTFYDDLFHNDQTTWLNQ